MGSAYVSGAIGTYYPSGPVAITAFILFDIVVIYQWYQYWTTRPRERWTLWLVTATTLTSLGYLIRFTRRNGLSAWSFLFETCFILIAPCSFLAHTYMILPRLADHLDARDCLAIPRKAAVALFVAADVVTVLAQLAGTALQATYGDLVSIGVKVAAAGLWIQLVFFSGFVVLYIVFGRRLAREASHHKKWAGDGAYLSGESWRDDWRALYRAMAVVAACMMVRSIYRAAEFTAGAASSLGDSEPAFYVLDSLPMLIVTGT